MKHINSLLSDYRESVARDALVLTILGVVLAVLAAAYVVSNPEVYKTPLSIADSLILISRTYYFGTLVAPVTVISFWMISRYDLRFNRIILEAGYHQVWTRQAVKMFITVFLVTLFLLAVALILGAVFGESVVNFNQRGSLFSLFAYQNTIANPSIIYIGLIFFTRNILVLATITTFSLLLDWLGVWRWLTLTFVIGIGLLESINTTLGIFYSRVSIEYVSWLDRGSFNLGQAVLILVFLFACGWIIARKKGECL